MLERFIEYVSGHAGVRWVTFEEIADDFVRRYPRGGNARPESIV
jgi:peptidoglycan-N-acetylglucosamine deacetylase